MRLVGCAIALTLVVAVVAMPIADEMNAAAPKPADAVDELDGLLKDWCTGAGALTPECGGFIGGIVWSGARTNCSYVLLDNETDKTKDVAALTACADSASARDDDAAAVGFTAFDNPTKQILYASGDGAYVWGVSVVNGKQSQVAPLPSQYAQIVALAVANGMGAQQQGGWYVVTVDALLQVTPATASAPGTVQQVMDLSGLSLSATTRATAYNTTLYLLDRATVYVVDLTRMAVTDTVTVRDAPTVEASATLQFWPTNNTLVVVSAARNIVQIDFTGRSYVIASLPAGQGAVASATNFFDMWFGVDDTTMFLVNLSAKKLETSAPWPGAYTESQIQYYF